MRLFAGLAVISARSHSLEDCNLGIWGCSSTAHADIDNYSSNAFQIVFDVEGQLEPPGCGRSSMLGVIPPIAMLAWIHSLSV
jgi:hypothetical protein